MTKKKAELKEQELNTDIDYKYSVIESSTGNHLYFENEKDLKSYQKEEDDILLFKLQLQIALFENRIQKSYDSNPEYTKDKRGSVILYFNKFKKKYNLKNYEDDLSIYSNTDLISYIRDVIRDFESGVAEPATKENNADQNFWSINEEQKVKIFKALDNKKILKYSGEGKPSGNLKNLILTFKALHDLKMIDKDLIKKQTDVRDEVWQKDFVESEFSMEGNRSFKKTTIRDGKKKYYTERLRSVVSKEIERIKSIIQYALTT